MVTHFIYCRRREALLKVTQDDIKRVANEYLEKQVKANEYSSALLGETNDQIVNDKEWHVNQWNQ